MVKEIINRKDIQVKESPIPYIKDKSSSIHKSLTSKKTAITTLDHHQAMYCQKQHQCNHHHHHKATATPATQGQPLMMQNVIVASASTPQQAIPAQYYNGNMIQLVPQVTLPRPVQYQVLVPIEPTPVTLQKSQTRNVLVPVQVKSEGCCGKRSVGDVGEASSSDRKKASSKILETAQSSSGHISAANTAISNESLSESEVEIEIPGGFDNIQSFENDMSCSNADSSEYVTLPKLEKWIGLDWDDVSITSDVSQNRKDYFKGVQKSHLACTVCSKTFRTQVERLAHELSHESENPFKCPHIFCTSRYDKAYQLKSHMRKRHPKQWPKFEKALLNSIENERRDEVALLLQPSDSMLEALHPSALI